MNLFLRSLVQSVAFAMVVVMTVFLVFYFGPGVESRFFPVITNARVIPVPNDASPQTEGMRLLLHSIKERENCELVNRLVTVRVLGEEWVRASAYFKDPATSEFVPLGKTRPVGDIVVDEVQIKPKGEGIHIVLVHRCHPFWLTTTTEANIHTIPALKPELKPPQR